MEIIDPEFEIRRPRDTGNVYSFYIRYKFNRLLKRVKSKFRGASLLDLCCGSGMFSEFYAGEAARVVGIDYSVDCVKRAHIRKKRYGFPANFIAGDGQKLPFADKSFDWVTVHDGLHHLPDPQQAVLEMCRVARKGVSIIEPAKCLITRVSIAFGVSTEYEGEDHVYRFTASELKAWLKRGGFSNPIIDRYIMFYPHIPGRLFRVFDNPILFGIFRVIFYLCNSVFGSFGNKIHVVSSLKKQ